MKAQIDIALSDDDVERIARSVAAKLHGVIKPKETVARRLTVPEVAAELRCSTRQVRRLIACGRLASESLAIGGSSRVLIKRAELDRLLSQCER